ncbi:MAG: deoxyribonuclease IV [Nitrospinota bacterium]|nr:MAG: deoxyribonuclease IV [Nitrospinota bacterium]
MKLGAHMSIAGGLARALQRGAMLGCNTVQIFTKNANQWRAKPLSPAVIAAFLQAKAVSAIDPVIAHDSYLINLASPDDQIFQKSLHACHMEMERCECLQIPFLVMHPGAHKGKGEEEGIRRIVQALDHLHARTDEFRLKLTLETTAGQGTAIGYRFEQLAQILARVQKPDRLAICLDTAHIFAAGYDIRTPAAYQATLKAFDQTIGLERLAVIHLNDSQKPLGSRIDRHAHIGQGYIGKEGFVQIVRDPRLAHIPMILETPKEDDADRRNLALLRKLAQQQT